MAASALTPDLQAGNTTPKTRIRSVDLLRGAVMILMAIDHVRVYSGILSGGHTTGIFFTRWVTHFCVPAFVFFAGTSAFLYARKLTDKSQLSHFLFTRGLLLVILELTLIRFCWTFNLNYGQFTLAGVIWMLGCCMMLLAIFVRLSTLTIGITGLAIIFLQQLFQYVPYVLPVGWQKYFGWFWGFIYPSGLDGPPGINILYVLVPWIGVMMAGYAFGKILTGEPSRMQKLCLRIGLSAIALFLIAGSLMICFGPAQKGEMPFIFRLLNQQKYPASQLYLLMTIGPLIALIPFAERVKGWFADILTTFGRVPMFYYLLHILLIHFAAITTNLIISGNSRQEFYGTAPYVEIPGQMHWGLPLLYLVYFIVVVILYFACRWYSRYKFSHPEKKSLKYL